MLAYTLTSLPAVTAGDAARQLFRFAGSELSSASLMSDVSKTSGGRKMRDLPEEAQRLCFSLE
jgi:hypothetical protein